jgi:hypothetical protein
VLKLYRHDGFADGTDRWSGPVDVDSGWNSFSRVFAGGDGVLYGIGADGSLRWYRVSDAANLVAQPAAGSPMLTGPKVVGSGWGGMLQVFSSGAGVIYVVRPDGTLWWYHHKGYLTGAFDWDAAKQVGNGWAAFKTLFSPGQGLIYAVKPDGEVMLYTHLGYTDGSFRWQGPVSLGVPAGSDVVRVLSVMWNTAR